MNLIEYLRDREPCYPDRAMDIEAAAALESAIDIARALSRLATMPGNPPQGSIGEQVARLEALEKAIERAEKQRKPA